MLSIPLTASNEKRVVNRAEISKALRESSAIMKEEAKRWEKLHGSPSESELTLTEEQDAFIIKIEIDPVVRNVINSQPITREYRVEKDPRPDKGILNKVLEYSNLYLSAGWNVTGIDAGLTAGYSPPIMNGFGIGASLFTRSLNVSGYYSFGRFELPHVIIGMGIGTDYDGAVITLFTGVRI